MRQVVYVPILKAKKGEYDALLKVSPSARPLVLPLMELQEIPLSWKNHAPTRTLRDHLELLAKSIGAWSTSGGSNVLVEVGRFPESPKVAGESPLEFIVKEADRLGGKPVPVAGLRRTPGIRQATRRIAENSSLGACVRLDGRDCLVPADVLDSQLDELLQELGVDRPSCDLLVDFGEIPAEHSGFTAQAAASLINSLPEIATWRNIITAGSSMPKTVSGLPLSEVVSVVREEWIGWKALSEQVPLKRLPLFGDYGVAHPESLEQGSFIGRNIAAKVRYTIDGAWILVRNDTLKRGGDEQFHDLCALVCDHQAYCGPSFSWGDERIYKCSRRECGPGNLTTWVTAATSHHIAFVVSQLASESEPSDNL
jgi:hypothetical protein